MVCCSFPQNKYEKWSRTRLENIRLHPDQKFFAEQLCNTAWWPKLYEGKFKTLPVQELIRRFRIYTDPAQVLPCLLVDSSRTLLAKAFTFFILSNYFTGSNVDDRFSLSLKELMTGDITWKQLKQKTARKKVIIIEIGDLEINSQKAIILTRVADLIRNRAPQDPVYIFHGNVNISTACFRNARPSKAFLQMKPPFTSFLRSLIPTVLSRFLLIPLCLSMIPPILLRRSGISMPLVPPSWNYRRWSGSIA